MQENPQIVITGTNSITAVGHSAAMTAASVRAGISRLVEYDEYFDIEGNQIQAASIAGLFEDEELETVRMAKLAEFCLTNLLENGIDKVQGARDKVHFLLGVASESRPGPRYEGGEEEIAHKLLEKLRTFYPNAESQVFKTGNAAAVRCLETAVGLLRQDTNCFCIIGGFDSLLALETLDWFEESERLKSESFGRNQAFQPGEAVGFTILETAERAGKNGKTPMAEVLSVALAEEPGPFLSDKPSKGEGLTNACRKALSESATEAKDIDAVLGDLNGEFYRSKEWGYVELRCFGNTNEKRKLWHPAEFLGDVGAASGSVLMNIAANGLQRGWLGDKALVFCSDDEGERGAVVLRAYSAL